MADVAGEVANATAAVKTQQDLAAVGFDRLKNAITNGVAADLAGNHAAKAVAADDVVIASGVIWLAWLKSGAESLNGAAKAIEEFRKP